MKFTLHDMTAYGIYNGFDYREIEPLIKKIAKEMGVEFCDYSDERISSQLRDDEELEQIAQTTYVPDPMHDDWCDRYKSEWAKMAEAGKAPGHGDVPDEIVRKKIVDILSVIYRDVTAPRLEKEAKEKARWDEILSHISSIKTEEKIVYDEGGKTIQYTHHVTMPSGKVYDFIDRNIFDFGRTLTCNGKMLWRTDDEDLAWHRYVSGGGYVSEPVDENDESVLAHAAASLFGHAGSRVRM